MVYNYLRSKATADKLIARFGQPAILRLPTTSGPVYNPTAGAPIDYPCTVVVMDFSTHDLMSNPGGRILSQDKKVLLAKGSLSIDPTPAYKLVIGGQEHRIVGPTEGLGIKTLAPGGVTVLYELQVRR